MKVSLRKKLKDLFYFVMSEAFFNRTADIYVSYVDIFHTKEI